MLQKILIIAGFIVVFLAGLGAGYYTGASKSGAKNIELENQSRLLESTIIDLTETIERITAERDNARRIIDQLESTATNIENAASDLASDLEIIYQSVRAVREEIQKRATNITD
jgi:chromosome segregation ATPase